MIHSELNAKQKKLSIADYQILGTLGSGKRKEKTIGAFGVVRLAKDKKTQQEVAVKIMRKHELMKNAQVEHIASEYNVISVLHHPFIVLKNHKC